MTPLEQLKAVLCDPEGTVCIAGSQGDRDVIQAALKALERESIALEQNLESMQQTNEALLKKLTAVKDALAEEDTYDGCVSRIEKIMGFFPPMPVSKIEGDK